MTLLDPTRLIIFSGIPPKTQKYAILCMEKHQKLPYMLLFDPTRLLIQENW